MPSCQEISIRPVFEGNKIFQKVFPTPEGPGGSTKSAPPRHLGAQLDRRFPSGPITVPRRGEALRDRLGSLTLPVEFARLEKASTGNGRYSRQNGAKAGDRRMQNAGRQRLCHAASRLAAIGPRQTPSAIRPARIPPASGTTATMRTLSSVLPPTVYEGS